MDYLKAYNHWLDNVLPEEKQELIDIFAVDSEIRERFLLSLDFGTAGMRGILGLGTYRMNVYTVRRATKGLSDYISSSGDSLRNAGVVIAYDTRKFSYEFALAAASVLSYNKIKVYLFEDVRPVPMCSFAVRHLKAAAGIMITASHNPKEYNGYKVYGSDGAQMSIKDTSGVVDNISKITDYFDILYDKLNKGIKIKGLDNEYINDYIKVIGESVDKFYYDKIREQSLSNVTVKADDFKIVYTPIHGAGYIPVTRVLSGMGFNISVVEREAQADGNFPTVSAPNPENADALRLAIEQAKASNADIVIGTDPDADRMGAAIKDEKGEYYLLNGNQIGALLLDYILKRKTELSILPANAAVIKTIVTSSIAYKIADYYGVKIFDVLTGFKYIGEKIKEWEESLEYNFIFGYEESYGSLAGTHSRDKDAIVASMLFSEMAAYYKNLGLTVDMRLKELYRLHGYYTDLSVSITYSGLDGMDRMQSIMAKLRESRLNEIADRKIEYYIDYDKQVKVEGDKVENVALPRSDVMYYGLEDKDWVVIRPSGTEPKLKIYVSVSSYNKDISINRATNIIDYMKDLL